MQSEAARFRDSFEASGDALNTAGHLSLAISRDGNIETFPLGTEDVQYPRSMQEYLFPSVTDEHRQGEQMKVMNRVAGKDPNTHVQIRGCHVCRHVHRKRERPT